MKILFIFAIISLSLFASNVYAWEPPLECADEDREIQGNRTTPCKLVVPELTKIEYRVRLDYPNCAEELVFHMPGISYPEQGIEREGILAVEKWLRKSEQGDKWNRCLIEGMIVLSETGARDEQTTPP